MNTTQLRLAGAALLFVFIFVFGFWLSRSGKPYHIVIFTLHKLIALGAILFLAVTVYKMHSALPLSPTQISVIAITALCFVATMATGALLSIDKVMPPIVLRLHQITPYLTLLSTAGTLYLLLVKSGELLRRLG
jgi:hypothetical protein